MDIVSYYVEFTDQRKYMVWRIALWMFLNQLELGFVSLSMCIISMFINKNARCIAFYQYANGSFSFAPIAWVKKYVYTLLDNDKPLLFSPLVSIKRYLRYISWIW